MKFLLVLLLLLTGTIGFAGEVSVPVLKVFSSKVEFVVPKTPELKEGTTLYFKTSNKNKIPQATIQTCKLKTCLARLEAGIFELDPSNPKRYPAYSIVNENKYSLYAGYGSPVGGAIRLGFRKEYSDSFSYGALLGSIDSTSGIATIKGISLSGLGIYQLFKHHDWIFNLNGEVGYLASTIELVGTKEAIEAKENVFMAAVSLETLYSFGRILAGINLGLSMNGSKTSYESETAEYGNPFGKPLTFLELGLHYNF